MTNSTASSRACESVFKTCQTSVDLDVSGLRNEFACEWLHIGFVCRKIAQDLIASVIWIDIPFVLRCRSLLQLGGVTMGFARFILRRLLLMIPILFGVLLLTFVVSHVVTPYPARAWAGPRASESTVQTIANRYHLNDPLPIQFYYYLSDLFRGDWGVSPSTGQPVLANILAFFPATIELTIVAFLLSVAVGIPLGVVSAVHRDQPVDHLLRLVSLSGIASPPFLVALLMQLILFYYLRIFPESGGRISPLISPPTHITGLFLVDSLLTGNLPAFVSSLQHILMPALALALVTFGLATRLTRASMLEVLRTDYVRTARAKGLNNRTVIYKHALRNAL